jgi:hypothetical protein
LPARFRVHVAHAHGDGGDDAGRALAERTHEHGVAETDVLHQDLVYEDGRGRGGQVEQRIHKREERFLFQEALGAPAQR